MHSRIVSLFGGASLILIACGGDEESSGLQCMGNELSLPGRADDPCSQSSAVCVAAGGKAYAKCIGGKWSQKCDCVMQPSSSPTTTSMNMPATAAAVCGDGQITAPIEACDKTNLNGASCQSLGYSGGTLLCSATNCTYDTIMCRMTMPSSGAGMGGGAGLGGGAARR